MISLYLRLSAPIVLAIGVQCCLLSDKVLAHEGWGIVVDRQGLIYFSDIPTNTIWRITPEGQPEVSKQ